MDCSIILYLKNKKTSKNGKQTVENVVAVFPACEYDNGSSVFSHGGSSYGGPVFSTNYYTVEKIQQVLNCIFASCLLRKTQH